MSINCSVITKHEQPHTTGWHPLHVPEIVAMIVSRLTPQEILLCRGISKEWREIFSPYLQLHATYWNHGAVYKTKFEARLETLGQFVQSLKQVYPIPADLERIERTCPELRSISFFLHNKGMVKTQALIRFLEAMSRLERIEVFSHHDQMVTAFLFSLATYQLPQSRLPSSSSSSTLSPRSLALKSLAIKAAQRTMAFPVMDWSLLEIVLKKHPLITELTLQNIALKNGSSGQGWARSLALTSLFGTRVQRSWDSMRDKVAVIQAGMGGRERGDDVTTALSFKEPSRPVTPVPAPVIFGHIETLVLDRIRLDSDLLTSILSRCPAIRTLHLGLLGSDISTQVWSRCLSNCRQLESITVKAESGGLHMDVVQFWSLAPTTLKTFHVPHSGREIFFSTPRHNKNQFSQALQHPPGSILVSLELCIDILVVDWGVRYVMEHCRSLERLVLGFQYFVDWEVDVDFECFPAWACSKSLKTLELRSIYRRYDQHFDERTHEFMRRLEDLKVLETMVLPAKLISDLSESQDPYYEKFKDLLDQLDHRAVLRDQEMAQTASLSGYSFSIDRTTPLSTPAATPALTQHTEQPTSLEQGHVWARDGTGPVNVIPPLPSVKEVVLTSTGSIQFQMQMRYLHVLMEALSNVKTIWTPMELYNLDCLPRFKHIHGRFQELYGWTDVELNLGVPEQWINGDR
ncbi:hypothetical protein BGZ98_008512 [Dissophora globulifera]|nr:hypothetical protein BGZ98_008512 [Dissophora globulifera]